MKGQFMLISSIVIGLIVISVAGTISQLNSQEYESGETAYHLEVIREEASRVDMTDQKERENFRKLVDQLPQRTSTTYWAAQNCFNVTITDTGQRLRLNCIS